MGGENLEAACRAVAPRKLSAHPVDARRADARVAAVVCCAESVMFCGTSGGGRGLVLVWSRVDE